MATPSAPPPPFNEKKSAPPPPPPFNEKRSTPPPPPPFNEKRSTPPPPPFNENKSTPPPPPFNENKSTPPPPPSFNENKSVPPPKNTDTGGKKTPPVPMNKGGTPSSSASTETTKDTNSSQEVGNEKKNNQKTMFTAEDSVSAIKYWKEGYALFNNGNALGDEDATYLSYPVFMSLSVLGGFFALDHLYLRSPWTFLAKIIVNVLFFGVWWLYDALQAVFHADTVRIYGLGVPGFGPRGIAAGVLANPEASKKHWRFFIYAIALFFGGAFGLDSFLVGDRQTGIFRLSMCLSLFLAPLALLLWSSKVFTFFTDTKSVTTRYGTYFGAAGGDFMGYSFPLLGWIFSLLPKAIIEPVEKIVSSITGTIQTVSGTIDHGLSTIDATAKAVSNVSTAIPQIADKVGQISQLAPATLLTSPIPAKLPEFSSAISTQKGGAQEDHLNGTAYTLLGTILFVIIAGFALTFKRYVPSPASRDDTPPQPGVFREFDSKKSTSAA